MELLSNCLVLLTCWQDHLVFKFVFHHFVVRLDTIVNEHSGQVFSTKVSITTDANHIVVLKLLGFSDFDDGHIKSATTKIVHHYGRDGRKILQLGMPNSSSGRLGDHAHHVEASKLTCCFCGVLLRITEVCRDSNNTVLNRLILMIIYKSAMQFFQDEA